MTHAYRSRFLRAILLGAILSLSIYQPAVGRFTALAQTANDIKLQVTTGFDGYCKDGKWLPLQVEVENTGVDRDLVTAQVSYTNTNQGVTSTRLDLPLPSGSRKKFFLYITPQGFLRNFNVSLIENDHVLKKVDLTITCLTKENMLFGVLSDTPAGFTLLNDVKPLTGFVRMAQLTISDLPDRPQAWAGLDALIISNTDTGALTPDQTKALNLWLASGGRLFVTGGTRWQSTNAGIESFLPVDIQSTRAVSDLSAVAAWVNDPGSLESEASLSVGTIRTGAQTLIEQDGLPILTQKQIGFGSVYYFAADPTLQPFSRWEGMSELYTRLLTVRPPVPRWAGRYDSVYDYTANQALGAIPQLGIPSVLYICGLLGVYVLVIGPLNYIALRVLKRRELAWITIPVLAIMFTCFSYGAGVLYRGRTPILNRLVIAQAWDGVDQAYARGLVGVYSPIRSRYALETDNQFMPQPFLGNNGDMQANNNWTVQQENPAMILPDVPVEIGGMKSAVFEGSIPALPISHTLTLTISRTNPLVSGTVQNDSEYTLHDVMLVTPGKWSKLGDLEPGAAQQISVSLAPDLNGPEFYRLNVDAILNLGFPLTQNDVDDARHSALLQAALANNYQTIEGNWGIYLMGWVDQPVLPISFRDRNFKSVDTMLYIHELSPSVQLEGNTVTLPVSLFAWEASIENISPYRSWQLPAGGYILRFKPGMPLPIRSIQSMTLTLASSTITQLTTSIWDYENHKWTAITLNPNNTVSIIPNPERYVTPGGEIQIRILGANGGWADISASYLTLVVNP